MLQETLGTRLKKRRLELGLSQIKLASAIQTTPQHISAIEKDKRAPSLSTVALLAKHLGVTTDYLIIGEERLLADIVAAVRAEPKLPLDVKKALVTMIKALRLEKGAAEPGP